MSEQAKVVACCISARKGTKKHPVEEITVNEFGVEGDAHAGDWPRQISLLAIESIEKMRKAGLDVSYGDFAENITTSGINLLELEVGQKLQIGTDVVIEVTQKGKECHTPCEIGKTVGECIMPVEGIFARVIKPGKIKPGDLITKR